MDFNVLPTACTPPQCDLKYKTGQTYNKTTKQHSPKRSRTRPLKENTKHCKSWHITAESKLTQFLKHKLWLSPFLKSSQLKVNWCSFRNTNYDHLHSWNAYSRSRAAEVACTTALCTNGSISRCGGNGCTRKHLTQHWVNLRGFQVRNASKQQHWASAIFQMLPIIVCSKATETSEARGVRDSACIHSFRLNNGINDAQGCHHTDWQQWPPFSPSLQNYRRYESLCARNLSKKTHTTKTTTKLRY